MVEYYFEMNIYIDGKYDLANIENDLGFKPSEILPMEESENPEAKEHIISLESVLQTDGFIEDRFTKFLKAIEPRFPKIKELVNENNGEVVFYVVFQEKDEAYSIGLDKDAIKILADLNASWYVD